MKKNTETWKEALDRFNVIIEKTGRNYWPDSDAPCVTVEYESDIKIEDIEEMEKTSNIPLPAELKEMFLEYAGLSVSRFNRPYFGIRPLHVYKYRKIGPNPADLEGYWSLNKFTGLATTLYNYDENIKEYLEPEIFKSLDEQYTVFGYYDPNISGCDSLLWFFDKNGNYGGQKFIHDDYDEWWPDLYLSNKATISSLDELISKAVDQALEDIESELEDDNE